MARESPKCSIPRLIAIIWTRPEPEHNLWYPARPGPRAGPSLSPRVRPGPVQTSTSLPLVKWVEWLKRCTGRGLHLLLAVSFLPIFHTVLFINTFIIHSNTKAVWRCDSYTELFMKLSTFWASCYVVETGCVPAFSDYEHLFLLMYRTYTDTITRHFISYSIAINLAGKLNWQHKCRLYNSV
jgi:hypothetical protein